MQLGCRGRPMFAVSVPSSFNFLSSDGKPTVCLCESSRPLVPFVLRSVLRAAVRVSRGAASQNSAILWAFFLPTYC